MRALDALKSTFTRVLTRSKSTFTRVFTDYGGEPSQVGCCRLAHFGRAFNTFYVANKYAFPGEEQALNFVFATSHTRWL